MAKTTDRIKTMYEVQGQMLRAISHPVRLAILDVLRDGEQCVCHMEANLGLRQAYISQHLMVLREAGLVADRKDGWNVFYHVTRPDIFAALDTVAAVSGRRTAAPRVPAEDCPCPKCAVGAEK